MDADGVAGGEGVGRDVAGMVAPGDKIGIERVVKFVGEHLFAFDGHFVVSL